APATTDHYTLALHDALPISLADSMVCSVSQPATSTTRDCRSDRLIGGACPAWACDAQPSRPTAASAGSTRVRSNRTASALPQDRSEEHTSELQSRENIVCRL